MPRQNESALEYLESVLKGYGLDEQQTAHVIETVEGLTGAVRSAASESIEKLCTLVKAQAALLEQATTMPADALEVAACE